MPPALILAALSLLASPLSAQEATEVPANLARQALFAEEFAAAREHIAAINSADGERELLTRVLDQCELASVCDLASSLIEGGQPDQAASLLADARQRLPGNLFEIPRANALHAIASAPREATPVENDPLIEELDRAIAKADLDAAARQGAAEKAKSKIDKLLEEVGTTLRALESATVKSQSTLARKSRKLINQELSEATKLLARLQSLVFPREHQSYRDKVAAQTLLVSDRATLALGKMYYNVEMYRQAAEVIDEGLDANPTNTRLLELKVLVDERRKKKRIIGD